MDAALSQHDFSAAYAVGGRGAAATAAAAAGATIAAAGVAAGSAASLSGCLSRQEGCSEAPGSAGPWPAAAVASGAPKSPQPP
eukprot:362251-Chlamydomonas_euryale.AAC.12